MSFIKINMIVEKPMNDTLNPGPGVSISQIGNSEMFEGKYVNTKTGNIITIRNTVQDGDKLLFVTDNGVINDEEFSSYIKCENEKDMYEYSEMIKNNNTMINDFESNYNNDIMNTAEIVENVHDLISEYPSKNKKSESIKQTPSKNNANISDKLKIFFEKINTTPQINIDIKWENFPYEKFNTICEFLDINDEAIEYIYDTYLSKEKVMNAIKQHFNNI